MRSKPEEPEVKGNRHQLIKEQVGEVVRVNYYQLTICRLITERIPREKRDEFNLDGWTFIHREGTNLLLELSNAWGKANDLLVEYGYQDVFLLPEGKLYAWRYETEEELLSRVKVEEEKLDIYKQELEEYRQYLIKELLVIESSISI